jgi:hypothetical protein
MNTQNEQVKQTADMLVAVVTNLRAEGAPEAMLLAYLKSVMLDQAQVHTRDRQPVLQLVNSQLGTKWSFNQVKKAEEYRKEPAPVKVQELTGTAQVNVSGQPAEASFAKDGLVGEHLHQQQTNNAETSAPDQAGQTNSNTTSNTSEENNMNAKVNDTTLNTADSVKGFELAMGLVGRTTPALRAEGWAGYIATSPDLTAQWGAFLATADQTKSFDENFVIFGEGLGEEVGSPMVQGFVRWCSANQPTDGSQYSDKSRYSLMGDRDEGIRTSWIAAGSAVIGGGMEMMARGGLTVGSGIGTVVGGIGAFFAGEQVDNMVESQFGRYVAGGLVGLAFGAGGSALGRSLMPGNSLIEMNNSEPAPAKLEAQPAAPQGSVGFFGM